MPLLDPASASSKDISDTLKGSELQKKIRESPGENPEWQ